MVIRNLEREWLGGEADGGKEPTSSSALGHRPAWNPRVLAPGVQPMLLGIRRPVLNVKHPIAPAPHPERKKKTAL